MKKNVNQITIPSSLFLLTIFTLFTLSVQAEINPVNCQTISAEALIDSEFEHKRSKFLDMLELATDMCFKEKNYVKMKTFAQKSAELGDRKGMANLSVAYANLGNIYNARIWAKNSCNAGFTGGCQLVKLLQGN